MKFLKTAFLVCAAMSVVLLSGCSSFSPGDLSQSGVESALESTAQSVVSAIQNQKISKIEVLSASDNQLVKTIDDPSLLSQFMKKTASDLSSSLTAAVSADSNSSEPDAQSDYIYVAYKKSEASESDGDEEVFRLTTYSGSSTVSLQISQNAVKNIKLPASFLSHTFPASDGVIEFLHSLLTQ